MYLQTREYYDIRLEDRSGTGYVDYIFCPTFLSIHARFCPFVQSILCGTLIFDMIEIECAKGMGICGMHKYRFVLKIYENCVNIYSISRILVCRRARYSAAGRKDYETHLSGS